MTPPEDSTNSPFTQELLAEAVELQESTTHAWCVRAGSAFFIGLSGVLAGLHVAAEESTEAGIITKMIPVSQQIGCLIFTFLTTLHTILNTRRRLNSERDLAILHEQDRLQSALETMLDENPLLRAPLRSIAERHDIVL